MSSRFQLYDSRRKSISPYSIQMWDNADQKKLMEDRMKKHSFIKVLKEVMQKKIPIKQLKTDRYSGIRKYMTEKETVITHQFDIWYFAKNIMKKI